MSSVPPASFPEILESEHANSESATVNQAGCFFDAVFFVFALSKEGVAMPPTNHSAICGISPYSLVL
jgi:hypothetical protein